MRLQLPFVLREIRRSTQQAVVFVFCMALSIGSIVAFSSFSQSVDQQLADDARALHAADLIIRSDRFLDGPLEERIDQLVAQGRAQRARYQRFASVVRAEESSLLAEVKIVEDGYPFYGKVTLASGRNFHSVLLKGSCIVGQDLLDRLSLKIGDELNVGYQRLKIADVVVSEPDRPVDIFGFGPRVFIAEEDREALGLIETGSRIRYVNLLKLSTPGDLQPLLDELRLLATNSGQRVDSYQTARSSIKRFLDNFLLFMKLLGFFIMILAGFGIQGTLQAFLNEKTPSIAIMKVVGASNRYLTMHFMLIALALGLLGVLLGLGLAYLLQLLLAQLLQTALPRELDLTLPWWGVAEGIALGAAVVALFAFLPLYRLRDTRPVRIFRHEADTPVSSWPVYASWTMSFLFFAGLIIWHLQNARFASLVVAGLLALLLVVYLLMQACLLALGRMRLPWLRWRQAVKGLLRPGKSALATLISLCASLSVIFCIFLLERNLDANFVSSFPEDVPNVFFIDIQPHQAKAFSELTQPQAELYPVIRARISTYAGESIDPNAPRPRYGDSLSRVFNITYRSELLDNEVLSEGESLFRSDWTQTQVSVLDTVVEMRDISIGDSIIFNVQGVPVPARVSSIRRREGESLSPFFYFVFEPEVLSEAPQTLFSAQRWPPDQVAALQNRIVAEFPNITVIDVTQTVAVFSSLLSELSGIVQLFGLFSISAGLLILVSTIVATRAERIVEAVYYKILGGTKRFVFTIFAAENLLIGLLSSSVALVLAQLAAWLLCVHWFDIHYEAHLGACLLLQSAAISLVLILGLLASKSIMDQKPITFLREHADA